MSEATANGNESKEPARDRPLCFHWKAVDQDWITSLDLPAPRNRKHAKARASVLLEALIANHVAPGQYVSYSRRKEWWSNGTLSWSPVFLGGGGLISSAAVPVLLLI